MLLKCEIEKAGKKEWIRIPLEIGTLIGILHIYLKKLTYYESHTEKCFNG